jgi:hypothetical protein
VQLLVPLQASAKINVWTVNLYTGGGRAHYRKGKRRPGNFQSCDQNEGKGDCHAAAWPKPKTEGMGMHHLEMCAVSCPSWVHNKVTTLCLVVAVTDLLSHPHRLDTFPHFHALKDAPGIW